MSLSGVLSKKAEGLDNDLDAIFQSSAGPSTTLFAAKNTPDAPKDSSSSKKKRRNSESHDNSQKKVRVDATPTKKDEKLEKKDPKGKDKKGHKSAAKALPEEEMEDEDADEDNDDLHDEGSASGSDSSQLPIHETLMKKPKKGSRKIKCTPDGETVEQRNARTIFIGNLPAEIVKNRSLSKKLKRHITELVPNSNIESIRFRSVPFQNPTSKLDSDETKPQKVKEDVSGRDQRDQKRAADWREKQKQKDADDEAKEDEKKYMTPAQKRRLAFIKGEVHDSAARVNAYAVFAHPIPSEMRPSNVPHKDIMDPFEAAKAAVGACNGTTFEEHTLHVDYVGKRTQDSAVDDLETVQADPKRSIFVGNLDFAAAEEDLRAFFEAAMCTERGSAPEAEDSAGQSRTWVTNVRVIRDGETQLGKGFGYVQFSDRECVDEILSLEAAKLKFAKRTLRVQRCKTLPGSKVKVAPGKPVATTSKQDKAKPRPSESRPRATVAPVIVPKGDPKLGEKLAGLSKELRKEAKAKDTDRVARRLAKKKAKNVLEKSGVKARDDLKKRVRERKKGGVPVNTGKKTGKPRVRSERATSLKNAKKQ